MVSNLTIVPGATPRYDDDGREIVVVATCGVCGRSWNDAAISSVTPVPSARCPFEYDHDEPSDDYDDLSLDELMDIAERDDRTGTYAYTRWLEQHYDPARSALMALLGVDDDA